MNTRSFVCGLAVAFVACLNSGCHHENSGGSSRLTADVPGRKIVAVINGPAFIHPEDNGATISFASHSVRVEKERALLDGTEVVKIPTAAAEVQVDVDSNGLTISADGKTVITKKIE